jgi:hypothetical protein
VKRVGRDGEAHQPAGGDPAYGRPHRRRWTPVQVPPVPSMNIVGRMDQHGQQTIRLGRGRHWAPGPVV